MTEILRPRATVTVNDEALKVTSGSVTLEASAAPYVSASLEVALISPADIELINPLDGTRAVIAARNDLDSGGVFPSDTLYPSTTLYPGGGEFTGRIFDLSVRSREVVHEGRTLRLELASDEAILQQYSPLTPDNGARAHETSLRGVVNYVLGKIGAELEGDVGVPPPDRDVTAFWEVTNQLLNPTFSGDVDDWTTTLNASNLVHSPTVGGFHGETAARVQSTGSGYFGIQSEQVTRVSPGDVWTVSGYLRGNTSGRTGHVFLRVYDEDNEIVKDLTSDEIPVNIGSWSSRVVLTATIPKRGVKARPFFRLNASGSGQLLYIDALMMYQDDEVIPFFTPNDPGDGYTAAWEDEPSTSAVTRFPIVERVPELFVWEPGTSAWDFLLPITTAVGLALFCDENRVWHLIDPENYNIPGQLSIAGWNATAGTDRISLDDDLYAVGVVVVYRWKDRAGIERVRYDYAGVPGKTAVIEMDRPYPGRGTAAAILNRRQGLGRTQDITALVDWLTTPTQGIQISLPSTVDTQGTVTSVTFRLDDGTMRVGSSGLIDIPPGSILAAVGAIQSAGSGSIETDE